MEFDIKPMKVIFDYMSNEITKLKAEKEDYKKRYLEQKNIADSLSDQINDNHSLVTESSVVKELQAEIRRRRRSYRQSLDRTRRIEREVLQEAIQVQQRFSDQLASMLQQIEEKKALALQQTEREKMLKTEETLK
jgi:predicted P-loop ATPase/GTPase